VSRPPLLDDDVISAWLQLHPTWQRVDGHLVRSVATTTYPASIDLLQACVPLAEDLDHHPNVTVGYRQLRFEVWTHDKDGLTQLDLDFGDGLNRVLEDHTDIIVTPR